MKCQMSFVSLSPVCKTGTGKIKVSINTTLAIAFFIAEEEERSCSALSKFKLTDFNKNPQFVFNWERKL